ncbi:transcription factor BHLH021 [Populus alba x Populus x berolinensis]|nr:transcription factor BHLH021 [Populus alba x Populus x berolinensis]
MPWLSPPVDVFRKVMRLNLYCRWSKEVMVCQAASQSRFRALKYENGIAGKPTIIVRVIACYRPLQDCQAEYFRHLLKPVT